MIIPSKPRALLLAVIAGLMVSAAPPPPPLPAGLWINPRGTVAVRSGACADRLCGWIIWAGPEALADARDGGIDRLVGIELLRDYRADRSGAWSGSVYVPDMGHSFSSTITPIGAAALKIKGCLVGGFICKSQVWRRIEELPHA